MYTDEEGKLAVEIARDAVERYVKGMDDGVYSVPDSFERMSGTFVTLKKYPSGELRGCIGYPTPVFPLIESLVRSAQGACEDPRFPLLAPDELPGIVVEVSLLTPPELVRVDRPDDYLGKITVGKHGLIAALDHYRGLLLPQVAVEEGWDSKTFLEHICWKAGLPPDSWKRSDFQLYRFEGEIFTETEPYGKIVRKTLS